MFRAIRNIFVQSKEAEIASLQPKNRLFKRQSGRSGTHDHHDALRIHGVPESEQKEDTDQIVGKIAREKLSNNISKADFVRLHRISRPLDDNPRAIIVDFVNQNIETSLLQMVRN